MKKILILLGISTLVIILLYIILNPSNDATNREIKILKQENKILKKNNDSIYLVIKSIEQLENQSDIKISILEADVVRQSKEVSDLNIKIKSIKKKYEKAINNTTNFTSLDIQRYFSDSLQ